RRDLLLAEGGTDSDGEVARGIQHGTAALGAGRQAAGAASHPAQATGAWRYGKRSAFPTSPHPRRRLRTIVQRGVTLTLHLVQKVGQVKVAGGFLGALLVYLCYADHFTASAGKIEPVRIRNIFSTSPGIRDLPRNFFTEFFATFIFIASILGITRLHNPAIEPVLVGLLVWAIGMGLGGTTGFAMNLARDMGPGWHTPFSPSKTRPTTTGNTAFWCRALHRFWVEFAPHLRCGHLWVCEA